MNKKRLNHQIIFGFHSTFDQLRMISMIGASLLSNLVPFSEKILRYLRENMKNNRATYALLLKIQQEMPKQVANSDTIYFEDVLGRTENLPYVYFKHWEVFQSMIEFISKVFQEKRWSNMALTICSLIVAHLVLSEMSSSGNRQSSLVPR